MFRKCERPNCNHYALHVVSTTRGGPKVSACHYDTTWAINRVMLAKGRWARITVATSSAVVVGDIWAWRTQSITAYEESRQIGA